MVPLRVWLSFPALYGKLQMLESDIFLPALSYRLKLLSETTSKQVLPLGLAIP